MRHLTTALLIALLPLSGLAETAEEKGLAIIEEADRRDTGWVDATAALDMILRNSQGQESSRALRIKSLEVDGDGDKSLSVFDAPKDIKGTALLSYTHALTPDDQWLYLPALKRVKRIASANKSGPFVGSEFAYEDLTSQEVEKYTYRWLRDEDLDGHACFVIEAYPAYENSGYTRQVVWLDQAMYQPVRIDYYDRKDALLKTLTASDWQQYLDRYWRPGRMLMENHQTGKSTELKWFDYQFKTGLTDRDFDQDTLKRTR
jgi:outer membrane lipoprotein-sorting protein